MEFFRRKSNRNTDDCAKDAVLTEALPERLALAEHADIGFTYRELILTQRYRSPGPSDVHRTELGDIGMFVAGEEIKDIVLAGIDPGLKGRPGDGGDGRDG